MTAELARSRGLDVEYSEYDLVHLDCGQTIPIDPEYARILNVGFDAMWEETLWRTNIPGNELADILEAGLVELEGDVVEP